MIRASLLLVALNLDIDFQDNPGLIDHPGLNDNGFQDNPALIYHKHFLSF